MLDITEVRVKLIKSNGGINNTLKAIASMTISDCFVIHDVKVLQNAKGDTFIGMPSKKLNTNENNANDVQLKIKNGVNGVSVDGGKNATHADIAHAINTKTRDHIKEIILKAYYENLKEEKLA
jgi:stage V sporulation protein G